MKTIFNIFYVVGWVAGMTVFVAAIAMFVATLALALAAIANWVFGG